MINGTDTTPGCRARSNKHGCADQTKWELMQVEVRLAKARATVVSTEIDLKTLTTRLRELAR